MRLSHHSTEIRSFKKISFIFLALACLFASAQVPACESVLTQCQPGVHAPTPAELLQSYYIKQKTDAGCSLATATMAINAMLSWQEKNFRAVQSQEDVLEKANSNFWKQSVCKAGPGISLKDFFQLWPKLLQVYSLEGWRAELHYVPHANAKAQHLLHGHLQLTGPGSATPTLILANFDQSYFVHTDPVGHFSPLGPYCSIKKQILVLDVDYELLGPYKTSEDTLLKSMNTVDDSAQDPKCRGYIVLQYKPQGD